MTDDLTAELDARFTEGLDLARVPHEVRAAIEAGGVLVDQLEPGLRVRPVGDVWALYESGTEDPVALVPLHRLRDLDPDLLVAATVEHMDTGEADRWLSAFRDGRCRIYAAPDEEWVHVVLEGDPHGRRVGMNRCKCVPGWPYDDNRMPLEERPAPPPRLEEGDE